MASGAQTFNLPIEAWDEMTTTEQWLRNQHFLDQAAARNAQIRFDAPASVERLTGDFLKEVSYMRDAYGYELTDDLTGLVRAGERG